MVASLSYGPFETYDYKAAPDVGYRKRGQNLEKDLGLEGSGLRGS